MKKIIVIDDDMTVARALEMVLEISGYEVIIAQTAESGLDLIQDKIPDLIICDYRLPKMNGLEFVYHVRKHYSEKNIPIFLVTGVDTSQLDNILCDVTVIQKPFDVSSFLSTIEMQLSR